MTGHYVTVEFSRLCLILILIERNRIDPDRACSAMRSHLWAFKALSRFLGMHPYFPLRKRISKVCRVIRLCRGRMSFIHSSIKPRIPWDPLVSYSDRLVITMDGSTDRNRKWLIAGFFNKKMKSHQEGWYLREFEALVILSYLYCYWKCCPLHTGITSRGANPDG